MQKRHPHNFFSGDFWGRKGVPSGAFGPQKVSLYRPYGKCYIPISYCFRMNFPKVTDTDTDGNCFGINKVTVTDTDPQKLPIGMPFGNCFGINKVTVADTNPHSVPSPSSVGLFGLIAGMSLGFWHNAPKILEFHRNVVQNACRIRVHTAPKCYSRCRKGP